MHFDAALGDVIRRVMVEAPRIEIAVKLAVDSNQQIAIEISGHTLGVVVGFQQNLVVFFEVHPNQQIAAGAYDPGD